MALNPLGMSTQQSPSQSAAPSPLSTPPPPPTTKELPPSPPASPRPPPTSTSTSTSVCAASASPPPPRSSCATSTPESLARESALDAIAGRISGLLQSHHTDSPILISLTPYTLADFEHHIQYHRRHQALSEWWQHRARYEYSADTHVLRLCMPTEIHERFIRSFLNEITRQIADVKRLFEGPERERVVDALSGIREAGSLTLELNWEDDDDGTMSKRQPDGSFKHFHNTTYPAFILEVAKTEGSNKLERDGHNWVSGTQALVKCVIGVCLYPTKNDKTATVSVWRGSRDEDEFKVEQPLRKQPFRAANDQADAGTLHLTAWDLLSDSVLAERYPDILPATLKALSIDISFARLATMLQEAEARPDQKIVAHDAKKLKGPKRKRSSSPEEVSDETEANFAADEEKAQKRAKAEAGPAYYGRRSKRNPGEAREARPVRLAVLSPESLQARLQEGKPP